VPADTVTELVSSDDPSLKGRANVRLFTQPESEADIAGCVGDGSADHVISTSSNLIQ